MVKSNCSAKKALEESFMQCSAFANASTSQHLTTMEFQEYCQRRKTNTNKKPTPSSTQNLSTSCLTFPTCRLCMFLILPGSLIITNVIIYTCSVFTMFANSIHSSNMFRSSLPIPLPQISSFHLSLPTLCAFL